MDNVIIRTASDNDLPVILGVLYDLGRPKPEKDDDVDVFRKLVRKYITDSDKKILVAELNDVKIIGMISIVFCQDLTEPL